MIENQEVLKQQLEKLLARRRSKKFYAEKLGITEEEVNELLGRKKKRAEEVDVVTSMANYVCELEDVIVRLEEDIRAGTGELTANLKDEIKTLEELIEKCKIDTEKWSIDRYVQNFWGNKDTPHWQVKAYLSRKTPQENFQKSFLAFLKDYKPQVEVKLWKPGGAQLENRDACLIINKQDEHLNKLDINGDNDIQKRFDATYDRVEKILRQAWISNCIKETVYILGSDQFNSEWTGGTTRGTPQSNALPYHEGFSQICSYELRMINLLKQWVGEKLRVVYVPGNHDEYVGWHLIQWLQAFYKDEELISFDLSPRYRKYMRFGNSAIMFNHGDAIKPAKLSNIFPIEFKDEWSKCENFYIFTGDKHHEVSLDFTGIKFYQLPALSPAKSSWDDKLGHTCSKAELTAFLIDEEKGMTNIYKQPL